MSGKFINFTVWGEPRGKGRPRFGVRRGYVSTRTPEETVIYENLIRTEYRLQCGGVKFSEGEALRLVIKAYFGVPRSKSKKQRELMLSGELKPVKKPDWDNIGKVVSDALNGVAYHDDSQVTEAVIRKLYADKPRVEIYISAVNNNGRSDECDKG